MKPLGKLMEMPRFVRDTPRRVPGRASAKIKPPQSVTVGMPKAPKSGTDRSRTLYVFVLLLYILGIANDTNLSRREPVLGKPEMSGRFGCVLRQSCLYAYTPQKRTCIDRIDKISILKLA